MFYVLTMSSSYNKHKSFYNVKWQKKRETHCLKCSELNEIKRNLTLEVPSEGGKLGEGGRRIVDLSMTSWRENGRNNDKAKTLSQEF